MALKINISEKKPDILSPKILVMGIGGGGNNALSNIIRDSIEGVDFVALNTDAQSLHHCLAEHKIQIGPQCTQGLGAGAKPDIGRLAAEESEADIRTVLTGYNMVFIAAGMGGGTGTGASPVIAKIAREMGVLSVGVVTKPFDFEGKRKIDIADKGIEELGEFIDTLIVIPNQNLFLLANDQTTLPDAFRLADNVLCAGVRAITDLILRPGLKNLDFNDVRSVMQGQGFAVIGTGEGSGQDRSLKAVNAAVNNPLLDNMTIENAENALINITGGLDLTALEVDEILSRMRDLAHKDAELHWGATIDESFDDTIRISLIVTGIDSPLASLNDDTFKRRAIKSPSIKEEVFSNSDAQISSYEFDQRNVEEVLEDAMSDNKADLEILDNEDQEIFEDNMGSYQDSDLTEQDENQAIAKDLPQDFSEDLAQDLSEEEPALHVSPYKANKELEEKDTPQQADFFDMAADSINKEKAEKIKNQESMGRSLLSEEKESFIDHSPNSYAAFNENIPHRLKNIAPIRVIENAQDGSVQESAISNSFFKMLSDKVLRNKQLEKMESQPKTETAAAPNSLPAADVSDSLFPTASHHSIPAFLRRKA